VLVSSMSVMLGPALPLQKRRFGAPDCRNRVDSWTLVRTWPRNGQIGSFLVGSEATLALTGRSGGVSGDWRTRMGHTCPLPGSMAPQGALCAKLARFTVRLPLQTGKDRALNKRRGTNLVLNGGLGGLSGARWTHMGHTYPLPGHMVPKGALCPSTPASPIAHPNGHPPVKRVSVGQKAPWGAILPGSG